MNKEEALKMFYIKCERCANQRTCLMEFCHYYHAIQALRKEIESD